MRSKEEPGRRLFREIMANCRSERRAKDRTTLRELAQQIGTTENYLSAVENGRLVPSLQVFLRYLLMSGFDTSALKTLKIVEASSKRSVDTDREKLELARQIYRLNPEQVSFLTEQARVAERYGIKRPRKRRPSK